MKTIRIFEGLLCLLVMLTLFGCNKIDEFFDPKPNLPNELPEEAKNAADMLLSALNIDNKSQLLVIGPVEPGTILREDKPDTLNPVELIIPNSNGPYYVFFIDDEPKMRYDHPMRYAYVNVTSGEVIFKDALYWMTLYPPNQSLRPFELIAYEEITDILFIMVEGEGAASADKKLIDEQLLTPGGINVNNRICDREGDCKKIAFTFDMGERERNLGQAISEFIELLNPWESGGRAFDDKADEFSFETDLMDKWLSENDFDVRRYSNYSGNKGKFNQITRMSEFDEILDNIGRELTSLEPPDCCHELFIYLNGHGGNFGSGQTGFETPDGKSDGLLYYDDLINKMTRYLPPYVNLTIFVSSCYDGCLADTSNQLVSDALSGFTDVNWCGLTIITSTDTDSSVPCFPGLDSPTEDFMEGATKDLDGDGKVGDLRDRFMHMREESKTLYPESKFYRYPYGSEWGALD